MGYNKLQMSWMPSLLSQKRRNGPPLGLRNLGNTCYLNSVLQCLTYTPPLANFCLNHKHSSHCDSFVDGERKRDCPFCIVEKRIARSLSVDHAIDAPNKISSCLKIFAEHFKFGRQEDAHEFLRYVIDACHNTSLRLKKLRTKGGGECVNGSSSGSGSSSSSEVKEIFGGAMQSQVKCLSCGAESNKADEIMDISLEISNSSSVKESLQKFFQPEILDGNNKYKCESCKKLVTARKQMSVLQAPNILVIQLKRFEGIFGGKIDKPISFGEILFLSTFMSKSSKDPQPEYKLFGIIVHSGFSPESGHYYAYVKDSLNRWYCCNDASVTHSTLQEVLSEKAYILFFSRINQRPASAKNLVITSNGTTSHDVNGSETPKPKKFIGPLNNVNMQQPRAEQSVLKDTNNLASSKPHKFTRPLKDANTKPREEQPFHKNNLASPEVEKAPLKPHAKISISVNLGAKRVSPTVNGRLSFDQDQDLAPEADKENIGSVSAKKVYTCSEKRFGTENGGNGVKENGSAEASSSSSNNNEVTLHPHEHSNGSSNGGDNHHKDGIHPCKSNGSENGTDHHQKIEEDGVSTTQSKTLECPTNGDDRCIFLRKDKSSRDQLEAIKESLQKDVSLHLRSCGWYDEVHNLMRAKKRLYAELAGGDGEDGNDLKRRLIGDVKVPQIPDELKAYLVNRLRRIGKKKYS
ncbi:Ubiquitin carboxyl-terminal hydrolase 25 [Hirschfeldia incana]|nr:Ubiquitin carboxyl-terminal hydrolase 25 [Hirschfeldia incana]